ncbi:hypothetical protein FRC20_010266 [Serendipita sp. 405]|nr:hypothetical protein FRC20_010266 [Serendipita sp. 405]
MSRRPSLQRSVRVENLSPHTTVQDIKDLFTTRIGRVVDAQEHVIASTLQRWIEITLEEEEAASKALTLSGHPFRGMPIHVGLLFDPDLLVDASQKSPADALVDETRRNLYVLGLPHDFTLDEFKGLFQPYGTIEHAVILAVLDNFSRRRGFVVFASHAQARTAMRATHKTTIKGHQLNVSWAVVQRSSGFLDGADRAFESFGDNQGGTKQPKRPYRGHSPSGSISLSNTPKPNPDERTSDLPGPTTNSNGGTFDLTNGNFDAAFASTLLVSNLCPWLFQTQIDVHALFAPYGFVKRIIFVPPVSNVSSPRAAPHAVVVEYGDLQSALSALRQLSNTTFGTCTVRASLLKDAMQRVTTLQETTGANIQAKTNRSQDARALLQPLSGISMTQDLCDRVQVPHIDAH